MRTLLTLFLAGALGAGALIGPSPIGSFGPAAAWADDDQRPPLPPPSGEGGDATRPPPPDGPDQPGWRPRWLLGRDYEDHDKARAALQAGEIKPLREVLDMVEGQFTGQMLEAELERKHGRWLYEIKVLAPDGSIMKLYYDAAELELVRAKGHGLDQWYCGDPDRRPAALDRVHRGGPHGGDHGRNRDGDRDGDRDGRHNGGPWHGGPNRDDASNGYLPDSDHHDKDSDRNNDSDDDRHSWW